MRYLAFDIGTSEAKAALIDAEGVVASASAGYPTHSDDGGVVEQDAGDWWRALVQLCRRLGETHDLQSVDALSVTGQMQDVIVLDPSGTPCMPVMLYSDTRARLEAEEIKRQVGGNYLRDLTGSEQDASSLLAKLLWLTRRRPEVLAGASRLLFGAADFAVFMLTGQAVSDTTTASTTSLMRLDTHTPLDPTLFEQIGIGAWYPLLPPLAAGGTQAGSLQPQAAEQIGLPAGLPVYHGPGDAGAATLGAGAGEPGHPYIYIGTSGWIALTSERSIPLDGVILLAHPRAEYVISIAPLLTAGGNLHWLRSLFGEDDYDGLVDSALAQPLTNLLYLPYLNGERSPFRDPLARGAFVGLDARMGKADLCRAVLEGVAFGYRHAIDALMTTPPTHLTMTGGGTRSHGWCQLFADIIGVSVIVPADAEGVGLRGAVLAAEVAAGRLPNYAPAARLATTQVLEPDSQTRSLYDTKYALYRDLYPALQPLYRRMG